MTPVVRTALALLIVATSGSAGLAQDLSQCVKEEQELSSFGPEFNFHNTCQVPVKVFYKLRSDIMNPNKINESVQLMPAQKANVFSLDEITKGGGIVHVVCPAGQEALEADARCAWRGRSGSHVCGPQMQGRPLCS